MNICGMLSFLEINVIGRSSPSSGNCTNTAPTPVLLATQYIAKNLEKSVLLTKVLQLGIALAARKIL